MPDDDLGSFSIPCFLSRMTKEDLVHVTSSPIGGDCWTVSANRRRHHMYEVFFHWLRLLSFILRNLIWKTNLTMPGISTSSGLILICPNSHLLHKEAYRASSDNHDKEKHIGKFLCLSIYYLLWYRFSLNKVLHAFRFQNVCQFETYISHLKSVVFSLIHFCFWNQICKVRYVFR